MAMSKKLSNYRHVGPVLDAAVANHGGLYKLDSKKRAFRWRAEAYMYRKLLNNGAPTIYDDLVLVLDGATVKITVRTVEGIFTTPMGEKVTLDRGLSPVIDPLEAFAMELGEGAEDIEDGDPE